MAFIELKNNVKIHYIEKGKGEDTILFIHGNLANTIWWEETLSRMPEKYRGIALDLPGSGQSPETGERHTMSYFAELVYEFTEKLGLTSFHLVGHSMGGGVSQQFTLAYPAKVKKLVLLDAMAADGFHVLYERGELAMTMLMSNIQLLDVAIRGVAPKCQDEAFLKRAVESAFSASKQVFLEQPVTMHEENWFSRLSEIKCPVLFLHGEKDNFVPKDGSERTAKNIPNCIFKYLPECGHSPQVEVPELFCKELFDFLN